MKIIYKSSVAKEQIEARNKFKCDGIELQMFSPDDSFEATKHSNHRVHSIHYPFIDDQCYFRKLFKTSALPDFEKTLKAAQHFKCGVVLHCEMTLDEFKQEFENGGVDFCRLLSLYKGVPIYLENSIEFIFRDGFENNMLDIPTICEILNLVVDNKQFFPLLDICHIASYFNTTLDRPAFGWSDIIEKYNSSDFNIHFNYALGNGLDERHGLTLQQLKHVGFLYTFTSKYTRKYIRLMNFYKTFTIKDTFVSISDSIRLMSKPFTYYLFKSLHYLNFSYHSIY